MSPTAKKVATPDPVLLAFEHADAAPLSEEERAALAEATADPRWVRISRGEAFERLVCEPHEGVSSASLTRATTTDEPGRRLDVPRVA